MLHQERGGKFPGISPGEKDTPLLRKTRDLVWIGKTVVMASPEAIRALNTVNKKLSKEQFNGVVYTASPLFSKDNVETLVDLCAELQDCCDNAFLLICVILELTGERKYAETLKENVSGSVRSFMLEELKYIDEDAVQKVKLRGLIVRMCHKLGQTRLVKFARNICLQVDIRPDNYPGFELFKYLENAGRLRADSPDGLSVIVDALDSDFQNLKLWLILLKKVMIFLIIL